MSLRGIGKRFGHFTALNDICLSAEQGQFLSLLGPSGCGKSTLLGIIAGTLAPDEGALLLDGRSVLRLAPYERDLSMVFQDYALFPHMSVADNIAFGLKQRRKEMSAAERARTVGQMLELVRMPGAGDKFPADLSGGQQQRVAIARALAPRPKLLLMDEPLSNLDAKVRESLRIEIKEIQAQTGVTTVYVTHDQEEALAMSDRIAVLSQGRIEQVGTPTDIYERPATRFVADFVGRTNILDGNIDLSTSPPRFQTASGVSLDLAAASARRVPPEAVLIRPEQIEIGEHAGAPNGFDACVVHAQYLGARTILRCRFGEETLTLDVVNTASCRRFSPGDHLSLRIPPEAIFLLGEVGDGRA